MKEVSIIEFVDYASRMFVKLTFLTLVFRFDEEGTKVCLVLENPDGNGRKNVIFH